MPHGLAVLFAVVGDHVDDDEPAVAAEDAGGFADGLDGLFDVVEHEVDGGDVEGVVFEGQGGEVALAELDVVPALESDFRRVDHGLFAVHGDDAPDVGSEEIRGGAGAAAEVGDDPVAPGRGRRAIRRGKRVPKSSPRSSIPPGAEPAEEGAGVGESFGEARRRA